MVNYFKPVFALFMLLAVLTAYKAEDLAEVLNKKLFAFSQENPDANLYVHTDKNIYFVGETIWFKAYMLGNSELPNEVLFLRLVDAKNNIVLKQQFPVYDIRANGNITLPDSLAEGNYQLYAYTDKMINFDPSLCFSQQISIYQNPGDVLNASAYLIDSTALALKRDLNVFCSLNRNGSPITDARCVYTLINAEGKETFKGTTNTNSTGSTIITLPAQAILAAGPLRLQLAFSKKQASTVLDLNLPLPDDYFAINVEAEGDKLVEGLAGKLLIETKGINGKAVPAKVQLKNGNQVISEISTDEQGRGIITMVPNATAHYSFSVQKGSVSQQFNFPIKVEKTGWSLSLRQSGKGFALLVRNRNMPQQATLVLRSVSELLWTKSIQVKPNDSLMVPIPMADTARQVLSMALFDSSGDFYNERLFVNQMKTNYQIRIEVNKSQDPQEKKINLKLLVTDKTGKPIKSNLSVAIVDKNHLDTTTYKTITQNAHSLSHSGGQRYVMQDNGVGNPNDLLIGKKWTLYNWENVLAYQAKGSLSLITNAAGVWGKVQSRDNKPLKIKQLVLMSKNGPFLIPLDAGGNFSIPANDLLADEGGKNYLLIEAGFVSNYTISIKDHAALFDSRVMSLNLSPSPFNFIGYKLAEDSPAKRSGYTSLNTVTISKVKAETEYEKIIKAREKYPPNCEDYVCREANILNCKTHKYGYAPMIGDSYFTYVSGGLIMKVYLKCTNFTKEQKTNTFVKSINLPKEFDQDNGDSYGSTIYWTPNINTSQDGEAVINLKTMLKGQYRIVVQGIVTDDLQPLYLSKVLSL